MMPFTLLVFLGVLSEAHGELITIVSASALFALQVPIDTLHIVHISVRKSTLRARHVQHSRVDQTYHVSPSQTLLGP
jgi:hypothetical protein